MVHVGHELIHVILPLFTNKERWVGPLAHLLYKKKEIIGPSIGLTQLGLGLEANQPSP